MLRILSVLGLRWFWVYRDRLGGTRWQETWVWNDSLGSRLGATGALIRSPQKGSIIGFYNVNIGALIIRIGFWGPLYYNCNKEPPK